MIALKHLTKHFGGIEAVNDVTLTLSAGEVVIVQGPSGSGKTTMLRLIAGLELPDAGQIEIDHQLVSSSGWATAPHSRGIGLVFQRNALWPHMNVAQNIRFAMNGASRQEAASRLREILEQTVLQDLSSRYPSQLSGGEARRVAFARAMAARPRRLLLDEPLTNLDPALKGQLLALIQTYSEQVAATIVYVTHDQDEAAAVGGRSIRMERGRILA